MAAAEVEATLQRVREQIVPESSIIPSHLSPRAHCDDTRSPSDDERATQNIRGESVNDGDEDANEGESRKRSREDSGEEDEPAVEVDDFHSPLSRPTEYLRSRCVACFGGKWYLLCFLVICYKYSKARFVAKTLSSTLMLVIRKNIAQKVAVIRLELIQIHSSSQRSMSKLGSNTYTRFALLGNNQLNLHGNNGRLMTKLTIMTTMRMAFAYPSLSWTDV